MSTVKKAQRPASRVESQAYRDITNRELITQLKKISALLDRYGDTMASCACTECKVGNKILEHDFIKAAVQYRGQARVIRCAVNRLSVSKHTRSIFWNDVTASMPDDATTVLLATDDEDVFEGYHEEGEWWLTSDGMRPTTLKIVAWAHMPVAPKKGGRR